MVMDLFYRLFCYFNVGSFTQLTEHCHTLHIYEGRPKNKFKSPVAFDTISQSSQNFDMLYLLNR